jgi:hypothetical protein
MTIRANSIPAAAVSVAVLSLAAPAARCAGSTLGAAQMFATVNADGSIDRGAGVTSVNKHGLGAYDVAFDRDVSGCSYVANAGGAGVDVVAFGFASAVKSKSDVNIVVVLTANTSGAFADLPFQLLVFCAR